MFEKLTSAFGVTPAYVSCADSAYKKWTTKCHTTYSACASGRIKQDAQIDTRSGEVCQWGSNTYGCCS